MVRVEDIVHDPNYQNADGGYYPLVVSRIKKTVKGCYKHQDIRVSFPIS